MNHLRFAFRQLIKNPGFSAVAIVTLALGIGANTAIFSIVNSVLLRPLPYPDADRIMVLNESGGGQEFSVSLPNYEDWKRDNTSFQFLAITRRESRNLSGMPGQEAERIPVAHVSEDFFKVIGLAPKLGRTFTEEESKPGGPPAVVISEGLWQRLFARDPNVLGQTIKLHNQGYTVIGVMPAAMVSPQDTDVWFPFARRIAPIWNDRTIHPMLFVWGRLKPGVTLDQARTEMKGIAARLEKEYPATNAQASVTVTPLLDNLVGKYRTNLGLLLGAVALVLLIACANLANLFAARGAAREREFAIRAAVGASRAQIVRQLLIESFVIALIGGALGFFIALWARDTLSILAPPNVPRFQEVSLDVRVLGFTFAVATITAILFGLWPAWHTSRTDMQVALKAGSAGSGDAPSAKRTRDWLVIAQIALTLMLLVASALVLKSFSRLQSLSLGYEPQHLFTARFELPWKTFNDRDKIDIFGRTVLDKVRTTPGIENAALSSNGPLMGGWQTGFWREGTPQPPPSQTLSADLEVVRGDYFATLKVPLLRGRTFNERDTKDAPRVIVVDQTMVDKYFPNEDPIGKRLFVDAGNDEEGNIPSEIVGVVAPMRFHGIDEMAPLPVIYCSLGQAQRPSLTLFVRSTIASAQVARAIHQAVVSVNPSLPLFDVRPMSDRVRETWGTQRLLSFLFSVFAGLALTLATIGLYGLLAYTTLKRVREIGIRLALGATPMQVRGMILSRGMQLLLMGAVIGFACAIALSKFLQRLLFEANGANTEIYFGVGMVMLVATLLACWIPARRASRVDPIVALRED